MSSFECYFLDCEVDTAPDLRSYADFFLNYQPSLWRRGGGDGVLTYTSDSGDTADLTVLESESLGISVRYNIRSGGVRKGHEYYSVANLETINRVEDVGDDQFAPLGSFLKPETAWQAVEDFFANPLEKSEWIEWINSDEVAWPTSS